MQDLKEIGIVNLFPTDNYVEKVEENYAPENKNIPFIAESVIGEHIEKPEYVKETAIREGGISLEVESKELDEIEITEGKGSPVAQRVLQLVAAGEVPSIAAKKLGTTLTKLSGGQDFKGALKTLIENRRLPAEIRREMVRAGLNDIFMENVQKGGKGAKIALAAAKQIGEDPEVGLAAAPAGPGVTIDFGKLGDLLANVKPLPGLEEFINVEKEEK